MFLGEAGMKSCLDSASCVANADMLGSFHFSGNMSCKSEQCLPKERTAGKRSLQAVVAIFFPVLIQSAVDSFFQWKYGSLKSLGRLPKGKD